MNEKRKETNINLTKKNMTIFTYKLQRAKKRNNQVPRRKAREEFERFCKRGHRQSDRTGRTGVKKK
ncbi:MAG: hypothetical protein ACLVHV_03295 [Oscillospiraceae bacterium]